MKSLLPLLVFLTVPVFADDAINPFPAGGEGTKFTPAYEKTDRTYAPDELAKIFQVEGDEIHVYRDWKQDSVPFATLVTADDYDNFVVELEYKWGERRFAPRVNDKRDAGLLLFVRKPAQVWPPSVECQIQETDACDLWSIYSLTSVRLGANETYAPDAEPTTIGKDRDFIGTNRLDATELPGWNKIRVEVKDGAGRFYLNDQFVNAFESTSERDGTPVKSGRIALQAEGAEITYRNVRVRRLE